MHVVLLQRCVAYWGGLETLITGIPTSISLTTRKRIDGMKLGVCRLAQLACGSQKLRWHCVTHVTNVC
jgi:hypothetical protein